MTNRHLVFVVGLLTSAALLSGCGDGKKGTTTSPAASTSSSAPVRAVGVSKAAYVATMQRLGQRLAKSMASMYPLVEDGPGTAANIAAAAKVEKTRSVVVRVAATLRGIKPPMPIRTDHERVVAGLSKLKSELDGLLRALRNGGSKPIGAFMLFHGLKTIAVATTDMEKKGYSVGG